MARSLTANTITEIAKTHGTEPVNIVGIFWDGLTELQYADKQVLNIAGKILSIGTLDEIIKIESRNTNASVEIVLDDTEGDLKYILDRYDIHKKRCVLYQYFDGLDILTDPFVVMIGEISTPIVWSESDRTLSLTIITRIESIEVGFAPEEGQFANVDPSFVGKVWPLAFGDVIHVPATKVTEKLRGVTQTLIGIPDYTLPFKYWHLIERKIDLEAGFKYYANGIRFLQEVARDPDSIIIDYINTILVEDIKKQRHEDLSIYISDNEKLIDKLEKMLESGKIIPETLTYTIIPDPIPNQGQPKPIKSELKYKKWNITGRTSVENLLGPQKSGVDNHAKPEIAPLTVDLDNLEKIKHLLEIETDNAEYAYKNILSIAKKIQKLLIEYVKTIHDIAKIITIIEQNALIPTLQVSVLNGYKFPQNQLTRIAINGLTYSGAFTGNLFSVLDFEPRYENIIIAPRLDDQIDAFWITDANINLKGHYCLTTVIIGPGDPEYVLAQSGYDINQIQNRIFKVVDQVGTKCILELVELEQTQRIEKQIAHSPVLKDLPSELWEQLIYATEHTDQQKQRILENAIAKYDKEELHRLKKVIENLHELALQAKTKDQAAVVNDTIFKNLHEYNDKVAKLRFTKDTVEKVDEKINEHEFKNLLKLCNLRLQLIDQDTFDDTEVPILKIYYLTGLDIINIVASSPVMLPSWFKYAPGGVELSTKRTIVPLPDGTNVIADFLPDSTLWTAEPGSEVVEVSNETEKYVANWLPSTIYSVYAFKAINGIRQLVPIPKNYYVKNENDTSYLPLHCTTITLKKPLKDFAGEDWEDGVYVSMRSSVGSNTVDIVSWILTNHTNITADATTFSHVSSRLINYPSSFALFDKKDALQLIEEICWQARCVGWVRNGIMFLKYLSEEPISVETITESDIEFGSLSLEYTSTEELITKFVAFWQSTYAFKDKKNQVILRYNQIKYSEIKSKDYDFYIYNIESLVYKSATFWLIRLSNTWKIAKFKTPLNKLKIETLDCITINTATQYFATSAVKAIVNKANYDSANNSIEFECWLPVRAGELTPYTFYWPADLSVDVLYPTVDEINAGYAGSSHGAVPKNLSYKIKPNVNIVDQLELRPKDYGDAFPADGANSLPATPLQGLNESDYLTIKPGNVQVRPQPRFAEKNQKPDYRTPLSISPGQQRKDPFVARVKQAKPDPRLKICLHGNYPDSFTAEIKTVSGACLSLEGKYTLSWNEAATTYSTSFTSSNGNSIFLAVILYFNADKVSVAFTIDNVTIANSFLAGTISNNLCGLDVNQILSSDDYNIGATICGVDSVIEIRYLSNGFVKNVAAVDQSQGKYNVITAAGEEYATVTYDNDTIVLEQGEPVLVIYDYNQNEYIIANRPNDELKLQCFVVLSEEDDHLVCATYNYSDITIQNHLATLGNDTLAKDYVKVAKPRLLQRTPYENRIITYWNLNVTYNFFDSHLRIASSPGKPNETQIITPPYFAGDIIVARQGPTGYDGIAYIDINEGGRQWALIVS